jgi:hypothetical protein
MGFAMLKTALKNQEIGKLVNHHLSINVPFSLATSKLSIT